MGKDSVDPLHNWRKKEKEKALKAKKKAREEKLSEIPAYRRDPAPLVSEIYRLSVLEYEGRLNSDMKQHKKRLFDQFQSIKKARSLAGLETVELVEFDPEAYESEKAKQHQKRAKPVEREKSEKSLKESFENFLDERGLPKLPDSPCPSNEQLLSIGLPSYSPFPYEPDLESEGDAVEDFDIVQETEFEEELTNDDSNDPNFDDLEAKLAAEYELFKESLDE